MATTEKNDRVDEPPQKRRRLSNNETGIGAHLPDEPMLATPPVEVQASEATVQSRESEVGIQTFINANISSFAGVLKTRYSDFIVNEILPSGEVVHLQNTKPSAPPPPPPQGEPESVPQGRGDATLQDVVGPDNPAPIEIEAKNRASEHEEMTKVEHGAHTDNQISEEQRQQLVEYLQEPAASEIIDLHETIKNTARLQLSGLPSVRAEFTSDRSVRSQIHQFIRETFNSKIDSSTDKDGFLVLSAAGGPGRDKQQWRSRNLPSQNNSRSGKSVWQERGGDHVHFTLYKENKDTMEAISWLTKQLRCNAKVFQFAGTKDRRAITTQRCSAYRIQAERLAAQNQTLRGSKIGDFQYHQRGLELGDLRGNEFVITLRDCKTPLFKDQNSKLDIVQQDIEQRLQSLRDNGYINYYGEQRFGTFSVRTDTIGRHILREDFKSACDAIISFHADALEASLRSDLTSTIGQDDKHRALAIHKWHTGSSLDEALSILPRKFSAETQIMRHLNRDPTDYFGALSGIQRNLRLMYVHAYQSLIWNLAATQRLKVYGNKVIKGDLVLVNEHKEKEVHVSETNGSENMAIDEDGEQIVKPADHDRAAQEDDMFERARALTEEEANSGKYSIFDVVLPQPGYDILYPDNNIGKYYETYMQSEEGGRINPHNMRRRHREFSLSGSYRKILARIGQDFEANVHTYDKDDEQFVKTDLDILREKMEASGLHPSSSNKENQEARPSSKVTNGKDEERGSKLAVVLKFQLGASQYATMALRELSRGGIAPYKPDYSGGR
ncbi:multisubstrate pseudouridine synthase 7 [Lithohypha guttulata]|uniref:multisubstrate pseudouridine synthase 7 n=1 Tax=Lithohypha guttulata TaxID=1690604 RepID=UPI002DE0AB8A|nr:multisubstrate pseudouridine synthase 7 [Lithohypha guttulata]